MPVTDTRLVMTIFRKILATTALCLAAAGGFVGSVVAEWVVDWF